MAFWQRVWPRRASDSLVSDVAPDLHILVADAPDPILAHLAVVGLLSKLVRDIPPSTDNGCDQPTVLDLRSVVLEGCSTPVPAEVVMQWLDCLYGRVDSGRRIVPPQSLTSAKQLLLLMDYTDTRAVVADDLASKLLALPDLSLTLPLGDERNVDLGLRGKLYYINQGELRQARNGTFAKILTAEEFQAHEADFGKVLCTALEEWMYLACRLQLVPLVRLLSDFVKSQLFTSSSVFGTHVSSIFSARVLRSMPQELLIECFLQNTLRHYQSDAIVTADGQQTKMELLSPESIAWFGDAGGETKTRTLEPEEKQGMRMKQGSVTMPVRMLVGGLRPGDSAKLIEAALAKAFEES